MPSRALAMLCPTCRSENDAAAEACFTCGKALHVLIKGTVLLGRYEIVSPLGRGGMGRVYRAHDRVLDEPVAIKVLRAEFAADSDMTRRFLSEIKLARKVTHRNVCRIHEYGEDWGVRFISMEFVDGITLKELLEQRGLTPDEAYDIAFQVGRGLQAVHEHGIIHRDFKAANIMIGSGGLVKLMDFGIAKEAGSEGSGPTTTGHVMGTPEYMSPEQVQGHRIDFRSDVYALGCVVYEIFAGRAPFHGHTAAATFYKHLNEPAPLPEDGRIPEALVPVLQKALAKDAGDRFPTVAAFLAALDQARHASQDTPPGAPAPPGPSSPRAKHGPDTRTLERPAWRRRSSHALGRQVPIWLLAALAAGIAVVVMRTRNERTAHVEAPATLAPSPPPSSLAVASSATPPPQTPPPPASAPLEAPRPRPPAASPPPASPASVKAPARVPVPTPQAPAPTESGVLRMVVVPPAEVTVDATTLGTVSSREIPLAPGPHVVRVLHPDYEPLQRKVAIRSGATTALTLDLSEKGIRRQP